MTLFAILRTVPNIADTRTAFDTVAAGFGENSIIQVPLAGVLLIEVLGAALLVAVFLGTTSARNPSRLAAPFAVGLTMAVLLQLGQAPGNTPFNPARATASALFASPDALGQLWLFWVAPLVGAALAGLVFRGFALLAPAAVPAPDAAGTAEPAEKIGRGGRRRWRRRPGRFGRGTGRHDSHGGTRRPHDTRRPRGQRGRGARLLRQTRRIVRTPRCCPGAVAQSCRCQPIP